LVITPICPHSLSHRPLVISGDDSVTLKPVSVTGQHSGVLIADGATVSALNYAETVHIRRSQHVTKIIKTNALSFYDRLRIKIR